MEHYHVKQENKLACDAMKQLAKARGRPYKEVKKQFVKGQNIELTVAFWDIIHKHPQGKRYKQVFHCPGCNKFEFEE